MLHADQEFYRDMERIVSDVSEVMRQRNWITSDMLSDLRRTLLEGMRAIDEGERRMVERDNGG